MTENNDEQEVNLLGAYEHLCDVARNAVILAENSRVDADFVTPYGVMLEMLKNLVYAGKSEWRTRGVSFLRAISEEGPRVIAYAEELAATEAFPDFDRSVEHINEIVGFSNQTLALLETAHDTSFKFAR